MNEILVPIIQLAISVCSLIEKEQANKFISELKDAQTELLKEEGRGDDADDGKIEFLYKKIAITLQAIHEQYALSRGEPHP